MADDTTTREAVAAAAVRALTDALTAAHSRADRMEEENAKLREENASLWARVRRWEPMANPNWHSTGSLPSKPARPFMISHETLSALYELAPQADDGEGCKHERSVCNSAQVAGSGEIEDDEDRERIGCCETCRTPIYSGDQYGPSSDGIMFCAGHTFMLSDVVASLEECAAGGRGDGEDRDHDEVLEDLATLRADLAEKGDRKVLYTA